MIHIDEALLYDIADFLGDQADADLDGDRYVPNKAMQLLTELREAMS